MVYHSNRMNFCMDFLRRAICNTVRMLLSLDRCRLVCIGMIPNHMPDKSIPYILPKSIQTLYYKWFYSVYSPMVDIVPFGHYRSLDRGIHCHRDTYRRISACMLWCSMVLVMGCSMILALAYMVFHRDLDLLTLDSSIYLCNLLPIHNHILHPDQQHHFHKWPVEVLYQIKINRVNIQFSFVILFSDNFH